MDKLLGILGTLVGTSPDLDSLDNKEHKDAADDDNLELKEGHERDEKSSIERDASNEDEVEDLVDLLAHRLHFKAADASKSPLKDASLEEIARLIKEGHAKKIIVMSGAGISTSSGIPDFRSPDTGLYSNLQKYNLPYAEAIFDIEYFEERPEAFFTLAKELYPGNFKPTLTHYFIKLLADKKLLLRNYTQNIDALERAAGIDAELLVEAHGTFHTARCITKSCRKEYNHEQIRQTIFDDQIPKCDACKGLVKPDIVFFGEGLPARFFQLSEPDFAKCDLLIVMGTSLTVHPFASLIQLVHLKTPRLLINREKVGMELHRGFDFDHSSGFIRDVAALGTCDEMCLKLASLLGWNQELDKLMKITSDPSADAS